MVSNVQSLRGLVLTAEELRLLTGWPDAMIEDYLNIIDSLIAVAENLDAETDVINNVNQTIEGLRGLVVHLNGVINQRLKTASAERQTLTDRLNDIEQLVYIG